MLKSFLSISCLLALACTPASENSSTSRTTASEKSPVPKAPAYLFDSLLADGFSFPFGDKNGEGAYTDREGKTHDGWYIATATGEAYSLGIHTGEDWNGRGGGNTDLGQPVYATALGTVLAAQDYGAPWGNVVYLEHRFLENGKLQTVYSLYAHLDEILVQKGERVKRRQKIGTMGTGHNSFPAHLHFELRKATLKDYEVTYWPSTHKQTKAWVMAHYYVPSEFIRDHRQVLIPSACEHFLLAVKHDYSLYHYQKGKLLKRYEIALSQNPLGHKQQQGDNRLPEGAYRITEKNRGPFGGDYKAYFGPAWMRLSYPNEFDARLGYERHLISAKSRDHLLAACRKGQQPSSGTQLGGGIGIHGWAGNWPSGNRHLTWGCISMINADLDAFYELVPVGSPIVILP